MKWLTVGKATVVVLIVGVVQFCSPVSADLIVFKDEFTRPDSRNIDATLGGVTDNTGSNLPADGVYTHAFIDPNNAPPTYGAQDGNAANGGGAQILNNHLELAVGAGTSNAYINHNFIDQSIINAGGFSVSLDVTGMSQSGPGQGGGFGIGMSAAEAASTGDAQNGDTVSGPSDFKMQDGLQDGSNQTSDVAVSDFWVVLRGDSFMQYGTKGPSFPLPGAAYLGGQNVGSKTGTLRADFTFPNFNDGTTVAYALYFNGGFISAGTFAWTGNNENYIGLDARDSQFVSFDNLTISTIPEPSSILLATIGLVNFGRRRRSNGSLAGIKR